MPIVPNNTTLSSGFLLTKGDHDQLVALTQAQFFTLMMCYVPFMLVPSIMLVDMIIRVQRLVVLGAGVALERGSRDSKKSR